jgi:hypothetical protein
MKPFGERDFTLAKYEALCRALAEAGYAGVSVGDYLARGPAERPERLVLLRHDVESSPAHALRMAEVERRRGFVATYFFRTKRGVFDPQAIQRIASLGHEIGYHYETLTRAFGDVDKALRLFATDLERLRRHAPVRVASMHGSPLLPWDNRAIWERARPEDFGLLGEAYRDIDYAEVCYYTDTGRTWHPTRYNVRDHAAAPPPHVADTTDELIELLRERRVARLCLVAHPERWSATPLSWLLRAARDGFENRVKVALARLYRVARHQASP